MKKLRHLKQRLFQIVTLRYTAVTIVGIILLGVVVYWEAELAHRLTDFIAISLGELWLTIGEIGLVKYFILALFTLSFLLEHKVTTVLCKIILFVLLATPIVRISNNYALQHAVSGKLLVEAEQRAEMLLKAIELYKSNHGTYPVRLEFLCPQYLKYIPVPGIGRPNKFEYICKNGDFFLLSYHTPLFMIHTYDSRTHQWSKQD